MGRHPGASGVQGWLAPGGQHPSDGWDPAPGTLSGSTHLFCSQMISGLGLPSALQVKKTVLPRVTSAS